MNKRIILAIMAISVTMSVGFTTVYADTASDKVKIQQVQTQKSNLESKVQMMDNQIEKIMSKIDSNENDITKTQKDIKQAKINIAKAENDIKEEQILFDKRMRVMYMNGPSSYLDILLGSEGVDDFISRLENIKKIVTFDQKVIDDLQTKKAAIDSKKVALDKENTKLLSLRNDNKKNLSALTKQKSDQTVLVAQLEAKEKQYVAQLVTDQAIAAKKAEEAAQKAAIARQAAVESKKADVARQARVAATEADAAASQASAANQVALGNIKSESPSITPSRGGATNSSSSLLAYASQFLGTPYVWGGTSPSGFDCSGFTQYVFAHFGVNLPRVSEAQQNVGTLVSRANLQPGDLVFFGTPAHHVGIYVGNGNMINAPHTGAVLRIQSLNGDFTYGRRVR
ncbi:NlpC/P60 family protein [Clostridium algoriphilum]|uniref:C40 family peptidase n=1 Tax=Clostridium algoriphilum TaxID=198347 RepID=UPI001CF2E956|nr:NlpC/P60 family protein [Clostridium algoriphilum]MCB2293511.1 NlpC/P60 family protein [Clostridium algoriphilum]